MKHTITLGCPPCYGCTLCCSNDAIRVMEELGDDPNAYATEPSILQDGARQLAHLPNGDCVYLIPGVGCSIWERRPLLCREFDCRGLALRPRLSKFASKEVLEKGRILLLTCNH